MPERRRVPPGARLPTLTEVVGQGEPASAETAPATAASSLTPAEEARIVDAVMAGLLQRVDLMYEYRLREALSPLLARAVDALASEARAELAATLRDVVSRAVSQELARRRPR